VIDAGFKKDGKHVQGDVGTNDLSSKAELLSPVPNGVGPMGVACLINNTITAALAQR
jgi:methylenetetrahydrofolate dehydrogenase (NADP+)/methenyltetrahydrofolate cyclohydrolase